jgi:zinc transport system substrate-binding protein
MHILGSSVLLLALAGCSAEAQAERTIVASVYPLAFAAERIAGPEWNVVDLTPPGVEAHDLELTLEQRSEIEDAYIVIYFGPIGFQPQVERAVQEAEGRVMDLRDALAEWGRGDPHAWLEPSAYEDLVFGIVGRLCPTGDACSDEQGDRMEEFITEIHRLHETYIRGLSDCRYRDMIVPHEAFRYLEVYGFKQFGLSGPTPEAEPSAGRLGEARRLVASGAAGALFYEARGEDSESAQVLANDLGVPALPLDTLESEPPTGDYFSVMENNLESLREGLQCR